MPWFTVVYVRSCLPLWSIPGFSAIFLVEGVVLGAEPCSATLKWWEGMLSACQKQALMGALGNR